MKFTNVWETQSMYVYKNNLVSYCSLKEYNCITDLLCSNRTVIEDIMVSMYEELHSSMITIDTKVSN